MPRIILILISLNIGFVSANELSSFPKDRWPLIVAYDVSGCVDDFERKPTIRIEDGYIFSTFLVFTSGGDKIVNPSLTKGPKSLTLHLETASTKALATACACAEVVKVGVQADLVKNEKIYVVVNQTVQYELTIPKQSKD